MSDLLTILLAVGGADYGLLTEVEQSTHDITRLFYTDENKTAICQCEGAAEPAKELCKFLQDNKNAWSYVTFELQRAIQ